MTGLGRQSAKLVKISGRTEEISLFRDIIEFDAEERDEAHVGRLKVGEF